MIAKPTVRAMNTIRKRYNIPKNGSITNKQYHEALELSKGSGGSAKGKASQDYHIVYSLVSLNYDTVVVEVTGNLLSRNVHGALGLKDKMRYSKAHKQAIELCMLQHKKNLKAYPSMEKATILFEIASAKGNQRDWDGNSESIKKIQDGMSRLMLITDDKQEVLRPQRDSIRPSIVIGNNTPYFRVILNRGW